MRPINGVCPGPDGKIVCSKCGKRMRTESFYTYKTKDPITGDTVFCNECKKCITMHVNNFEPDTFLPLLEQFDVPYIKHEWNILRDRAYQKDPKKVGGLTVFGRYLAKMNLVQWKKYGWADTERLEQDDKDNKERAKQELEKQKEKVNEELDKGNISKEEYDSYIGTIDEQKEQLDKEIKSQAELAYEEARAAEPNALTGSAPSREDEFISSLDIPDPSVDLTQEDKKYLLLKWGRSYTPFEWVQLEKKYQEMCDSFPIDNSDLVSSVILLCKTELKANQAIDSGDYDAYRKLSSTLNDLRKTSNFTAAQKKEKDVSAFDAVGKIVAWCEQHGGKIPRWDLNPPLDTIDVIIKDLKNNTANLFKNDPTMSNVLNDFIKKREDLDKKKRQKGALLPEKKTAAKSKVILENDLQLDFDDDDVEYVFDGDLSIFDFEFDEEEDSLVKQAMKQEVEEDKFVQDLMDQAIQALDPEEE